MLRHQLFLRTLVSQRFILERMRCSLRPSFEHISHPASTNASIGDQGVYSGDIPHVSGDQLHRNLSTSAIKHRMVTFTSIDDFGNTVLQSSDPVVINFHADWCQPCHILTPKLKEVVGNSRRVKLCTINIGDYPEIAQEFEVQAIPAVVAVQSGKVIDKFIGLTDIERIQDFVKRVDGDDEGS